MDEVELSESDLLQKEKLAELTNIASTEDNDEEHTVVLKNATLGGFLNFRDKYGELKEGRGCKFALKDGQIIIYEIPTSPHGKAQNEVGAQLANLNRSVLNRQFESGGSTTFITGPAGAREPDVWFRPRNRPVPIHARRANNNGEAYPTVVIEIGYSRTLTNLHNVADEWFGARTCVRVYLAIKLWPLRNNGTQTMLAMLYLRTPPPHIPGTVISFGTANIGAHTVNVLTNQLNIPVASITGVGRGGPACNAAGLAQYQVSIPTVQLYDGVPGGVPAGQPANVVIDLFEVQAAVL